MPSVDVSVIIPVYNSEKYIRQCVDSLICQTLKNVEYIFIDDGSVDDSIKLISEYQKNDKRIKIFKQNHLYAGAARNKGIREAQGKYIAFLDSDDFFEKNALKSLYICAEKNNSEIVIFNSYHFNNDLKTKNKDFSSTFPRCVFSYKDVNIDFFRACRQVPWNKFFLKKFLIDHSIYFPELKKNEDIAFALLSVSLANRIVYLDYYLINYRLNNPNSLSGRVGADMDCLIKARIILKQELIENKLFSGRIRKSFFNLCEDLSYYIGVIQELQTAKNFYEMVKEKIVPFMIDFEEELEDYIFLRLVYFSKDFEEFIFNWSVDNTMKMTNIRNEIDYRLGHKLLSLPRKIKRLIKM